MALAARNLMLAILALLAYEADSKTAPPPPPLRASDLTNGTFRVKLRGWREENCLSTNVSYERLLGNGPRWRVPHSLITMDGVRCGEFPANSTNEKLEGDAWMDVFPLSLIATQNIAAENGLLRPYVQLSTTGSLRDFVVQVAAGLGKEKARREIILGYEGNRPRKCGSITVPVESFVVFSRVVNKSINFGRLLRGAKKARLVFDKDIPYHVVIAPAPTGAQRFCPYLLPDDFERKYPVRACFPADARVQIRGGKQVSVKNLQIGDEVEFVNEKLQRMHSPIILFTHRDGRQTLHEFTRITLHTGEIVTLSPGHYVDDERIAADIKVGDKLLIANGSYSRATSVQRIRVQGLYNPQTSSGRLIVNGVSVSAYTAAVPPFTAHAALLPFRVRQLLWVTRVRQSIFSAFGTAASFPPDHAVGDNWERLIQFLAQSKSSTQIGLL